MRIPPPVQCDLSDSVAQREIEISMLQRLTEKHPDWLRLDWATTAVELTLPLVWQKAKPDAVWKVVRDASRGDELIICECYARIGKIKAGHRRKLAIDALKLVALRQSLPIGPRVRWLIVVPEELYVQLQSGGWFTEALRLVEIVPVALTDIERRKLSKATDRQAEGQSRQAKTKKGRIA